MCGIVGVFGHKQAKSKVEQGISVTSYRGQDGKGIHTGSYGALGHCLHSIVGFTKQPIVKKGIFATNCEIYNYTSLGKGTDSEVFSSLIEKEGMHALNKVDGVYSLVYVKDSLVYIARDLLGVKPLWYSHTSGFAVASEKKALVAMGYSDIVELNPRKIGVYNVKSGKFELKNRTFFRTTPEHKNSLENITDRTEELLVDSIRKRIPAKKFGVMFSGGLDSTVLAQIIKKLGHDFTCYTSVLEDPNMKEAADLAFARKAAKEYGFKLKVVKIKTDQIPLYLKKIVPLIEDHNVVKVGVGLTFFAACEAAHKDGCKVIFSGLGSEEIFAGYERHKNSYKINQECLSGLRKMYERDNYRDDVITMYHNLELRVPFLDTSLVKYCLRIPASFKIKAGVEKYILRSIAKRLGIKSSISDRPKKAAQYGSNFHKALRKLSKKNGHSLIADYTNTFYDRSNVKLGALVSGGKDSIYALHRMQEQGYPISCMISIKSKNPDSYMFHTPAIDMVELQAKAMGIPVITGSTLGKKEKELADLKKLLAKAKKEYGIEGVISGALYSTYQRDRIEKICDSLQLKVFSPLWHMDQETEIREIIKKGFSFILTKVAAYGLGRSWLGRVITNTDVDRLVKLNKKIGINIAFEGGEAETLMIDGPSFKKKISISDSVIDMETEELGVLQIKKAKLETK